MDEAPELLQRLHGRVLRAACRSAGRPFEGCSVASRWLKAQGCLDKQLMKGLCSLDVATAWNRHANGPRCEGFEARMLSALESIGKVGNKFSVEERNLLSVAGKDEGQDKELYTFVAVECLAKELHEMVEGVGMAKELYSKSAGQGQLKVLYKQFEGEGREKELGTKVAGEDQEMVVDKQFVGEDRCETQAKELY